MIFKKRNKS